MWAGGIGFLYLLSNTKLLKICRQGFIIFVFFSSFVISAYISDYTSYEFSEQICITWSVCLSITIILLLGIIKSYHLKKVNIRLTVKDNIILMIVLGISVILRIGMLDTLQRWDAGEYYYQLGNACASFQFSFDSFFHGFRLCNHTTLGFSFIMSIGEFLFPRNITGVLVENLLLTLAAVYCLYRILVDVCDIKLKSIAGAITLTFSVTPFFLGSFGYITPDYLMLLAFIFVMYANMKGDYLCELFWIIIMINTKENAIAVVFGYYLFKLIADLCNHEITLLQRLKSVLQTPSYWMALSGAAIFGLIIMLQGGFLWKGMTRPTGGLNFSNTEINSFGFNWDYILFRCRQHFILNFAWVFTVIFVYALIFLALKKRFKTCIYKKDGCFLLSVGGALLFAFLTNALFITAGAYRYCTVFFSLYGVFALVLFYRVCGTFFGPKSNLLWMTILNIFLCFNAYIHIDPVSAMCFETRSTGAWYTVMTNYTHENYGNDLCNNYQYTWLDHAIDEMLADIGYDRDTAIILLDRQVQGSQIGGNGIYYRVCWDGATKKRVMYDEDVLSDNPDLTQITIITDLEDAVKSKEQYSRQFALMIPYYEVDFEAQKKVLETVYSLGSKKSAGDIRGKISYYELTLK